MRLPNARGARIDQDKILHYLLNDNHPDGRHKAFVFKKFGFQRSEWWVLRNALRNHPLHHPVVTSESSSFGTKFIIEGPVATPSGRLLDLRTVWMINVDAETPRLITAYPRP